MQGSSVKADAESHRAGASGSAEQRGSKILTQVSLAKSGAQQVHIFFLGPYKSIQFAASSEVDAEYRPLAHR